MEELDSFKITQLQLDEAAAVMKLDPQAHQILREPMETLTVTLPVRMDDGKVKTFTGFRVHYNNARGPCKGGIRYHPQENLSIVKALAAWMTWKTSFADIPFGGSKGGIICDPKAMSKRELEELSRAYIRAVKGFIGPEKDVPAPDVNTTPEIMGWMMDEYSRIDGQDTFSMITGKPLEVWGSAGRGDATGVGGMIIYREAAKLLKLNTKRATLAVQGFGNVGMNACIAAKEMFGSKIVAVSDSSGGIHSKGGLDVDKLVALKEKGLSVTKYPGAEKISNAELLALNVDVLIPAALENQIRKDNVDQIKAKLVLELANGPVTPEADAVLHEKKILDLPDFVVNGGGVMVSYFEWVQNKASYYWKQEEVESKLDQIMTEAFNKMITSRKAYKSKGLDLTPRTASYIIAVDRVAKAMKARGWY
jgi:glutamate dehydrogenase (NAD(P)+)